MDTTTAYQMSARSVNSARSDALVSARNSARSNPESARSQQGSARGFETGRSEQLETFRTSMSTARVHTALAALAAEKNALVSQLTYIDSALENEKKKRATKMRGK